MMRIVILLTDLLFQAQAEQLSAQLNFPVVESIPEQVNFVLGIDEKGLCLQYFFDKRFETIRVDFLKGKLGYRLKILKNELLFRAVGIKHSYHPKILDITAGLGRDAFLLAMAGCDITTVEKNPIIFALVKDGLDRASHLDSAKRVTLIQSDSIVYMNHLNEKPDVIYLDPMFPLRKKSAKVKKEMQVLEALLETEDSKLLFETALKTALKRVVVKRPQYASTITDLKPDIVYPGKTVRFDVYLVL